MAGRAALAPLRAPGVAARLPLHAVARPLSTSAAASDAGGAAASTPPPPPLSPPVVLYESGRPTLVLSLGRLAAVQSAAAAAAAVSTGWAYVAGRLAAAVPADAHAAALDAAASAGAVGGGDPRLPAAFAALALVSGAAARAVARRTVTKLVLQRAPAAEATAPAPTPAAGAGFARPPPSPQPAGQAQNPDDAITIHRPRLWRSGDVTETVPRSALSCGRGESTFQGFLLTRAGEGRAHPLPQYLFPLHGEGATRSDDLPYLKTLLFGDYFRPEPPPPGDDELLAAAALEGFGPYRPAQFADTHHPRFPAGLPNTDAAAPVPGTPFWTQHGTVWASFTVPPRPSLQARRDAERGAALYGARRALPLPAVPAPVSLQLDGSHYVPRLGAGGGGGGGEAQEGEAGHGGGGSSGSESPVPAGAESQEAPPPPSGATSAAGGTQPGAGASGAQ